MKITERHITPIALGDPPLLNAAGLHAPYCLRTVVELKTDTGLDPLRQREDFKKLLADLGEK